MTDQVDSQERYRIALQAVEKPVFVVGTMRSGTSFLGLSLDDSQNLIGCPFELRRIWHQVGRVPMASDIEGTNCPCMLADAASTVPLAELKRAFAKEVEKNVGDKPWSKNLRFLNKNPHLCNKVRLANKLFPDAQFLWPLRDMTSVVCSLKNLLARDGMRDRGIQHVWPKRQPGEGARCFDVHRDALTTPVSGKRVFPGGDISYLAEYWLESNLSMLEAYQAWGAKKMLPVPQSLMLAKPQMMASRIEEFLGLPRGDMQHLADKIDPGAVKRWPALLTDDELAVLERFRAIHFNSIERIEKLLLAP